ncbi:MULTISPECIES: ABC transporter permease [unclassified Myxococcus]|uniref:ABC transporter permease n=1 Tax=unclassified Myxococcus TaxID=2648731 RepID=UPI00157B6C96|nr:MULTISPECIES: ABC transporter permease subunit [unclassified Myxococcus]NTX00593.1 ABC transporter permease subunit [Myxococcus sp. CA040A]NTX12705.1 ABC transporter permease subunit [Myxococcus sp. CA056]
MSAFGAMVWNGFREARRNRVTVVVGAFAAVVLLSSTLITEVTVATFDRVLTDFGLGMMSLILVFLTIFLSSGLLSREIERRTIFLVVSKPVSRTQFLLARLAGNMLTLAVMMGAMMLIFASQLLMFQVSIHPTQIVAAVGLWFELLVLTSAGILFSSFTGPAVSAIATTGIYFTGHLASDLYDIANRLDDGSVKTFAKALYYLLPNLERMNFRPYATYGLPVDTSTFLSGVGYGLGWAALFTAAAIFIFERRDFR